MRIPAAFVLHDVQFGLPFKDHYFDYVVSFEMIKYLPIEQGIALLSEIHRVMNPKGLFFLSTTYSPQPAGYMQSLSYEATEKFINLKWV